MRAENKLLLFALRAGMELSYTYACVTFVTLSVFHRAFPFPEAVVSFLLGALLSAVTSGRGWRVVYVILFHALVFVPMLLRMVQVFGTWADIFVNQVWFTQALQDPASAVEYFTLFLLVIWAFAFWAGGATLATRQDDYATACARFDQGLVVFFLIFLLKFYVQAALGVHLDDPTPGWFIVPFLVFGLLAIGVVRNRSTLRRDFMPGYQKMGVLLGFVIIILLVGTGLVFFFLPYLTAAAQQGYGALNLAAGPVGSTLVRIWEWIFGTGMSIPEQFATKPEPLPQTGAGAGLPLWLEPVLRVAAVAVGLLLAVVALVIVAGLLYSIITWLVSKTPAGEPKPSLRSLLASFYGGLWAWLGALWRGWTRGLTRHHAAVHLYTALRDWGRASGIQNVVGETPTEYGIRLAGRFPALATEITVIVQAFNREVYGEMVLGPHELSPAYSAWRSLASPRQWRMRAAAWSGLDGRAKDAARDTTVV